jgi:hypothetical protein
MKPSIMRYRKTGLAMVTLAAFATSAQAAVILFSDDFNRTGSLNGSAPSYRNSAEGYGSLTWSALGQLTSTTDGGRAEVRTGGTGSGQGFNAVLAFTPITGKQYLFEISAKTTNTVSIAMGDFRGSIGSHDWLTQNIYPSVVAASGGQNLWGSYAAQSVNTNPSTSYTGAAANTGYHIMAFLLDTTAVQWTVTYIFDGTTIGTVNAPATIDSVAFGRGTSTDPSFDVRSLSMSVIPEPSNALLGGLGMLCLLRRRRA